MTGVRQPAMEGYHQGDLGFPERA